MSRLMLVVDLGDDYVDPKTDDPHAAAEDLISDAVVDRGRRYTDDVTVEFVSAEWISVGVDAAGTGEASGKSPDPDPAAPTETGLQAEVTRRREALADAEQALAAYRVSAAPFKVGDVVEARTINSEPWQPAIVREVRTHMGPVPFYSVSFRRRDGQWSSSYRRVLDNVRPAS